MVTAEHEARRVLNRLRRAVEKADREMDALEGALRTAEGRDFPEEEYRAARAKLGQVDAFIDGEAARLQEKILHSGGLEPGRVRRSTG